MSDVHSLRRTRSNKLAESVKRKRSDPLPSWAEPLWLEAKDEEKKRKRREAHTTSKTQQSGNPVHFNAETMSRGNHHDSVESGE